MRVSKTLRVDKIYQEHMLRKCEVGFLLELNVQLKLQFF